MCQEQFPAWEGIPVGLLLFSPTIPSWKVSISQFLNKTLLPISPNDSNYIFITLTRACGSSSDDTKLPYQLLKQQQKLRNLSTTLYIFIKFSCDIFKPCYSTKVLGDYETQHLKPHPDWQNKSPPFSGTSESNLSPLKFGKHLHKRHISKTLNANVCCYPLLSNFLLKRVDALWFSFELCYCLGECIWTSL